MSLLTVKDLSIAFQQGNDFTQIVDRLSFTMKEKETLAIVGESGCGKTVTAHAILQLLPNKKVRYPSGDIVFNKKSLIQATAAEMRYIRSKQIRIIFQDPTVSLNPLHTIEKQIDEILSIHHHTCKTIARTEMITYLERVGIRSAASRLSAYPHQLSSGEKQRLVIAMAIMTNPKLLIADEPTTALDTTTQNQIIHLLRELKNEMGMSLLFITHNLGLVKKIADNIAIMKAGRVIEYNNRHQIFLKPQHQYTHLLLNSEPTGEPVPLFPDAGILININHLSVDLVSKKSGVRSQQKRLLDNLSLSLYQGESVGLIGESGSGKSTAALAILKLIKSHGKIIFDGQRLDKLSEKKWRPYRKRMQIIFQDPCSSLNPRFTVTDTLSEGLIAHEKLTRKKINQAITDVMFDVRLDPKKRYHYIHEFSVGEQQRIAIARALILKPQLLILDEPTSSLDRNLQKQIIDLLKSLQQKYQLSYLFISHDAALIHSFCHQVLVIHDGKIIEQGKRDSIFSQPVEIYTKQLLSLFVKAELKPEIKKLTSEKNMNWSEALLFGKKT